MTRKPIINAEEYAWLADHVKGRYLDELYPEFKARFGRDLTFFQFRCLMRYRHLTSGLGCGRGHNARKLFTDEQEAWLHAHYKGTPDAELTRGLNEAFGLAATRDQIKAFKSRHRLDSGRTGWFGKGHVPYNKGKKLENYQINAGNFKKGQRPRNWRPVGSLRFSKDGYVEKKVREPRRWQALQRYVWERAHGPIPRGCVILFADGNRRHCSLGNLIMVPQAVNSRVNQMHLPVRSRELLEAAIAMAELQNTICAKRRKKCK